MYISSGKTSPTAFSKVKAARAVTDFNVAAVLRWPSVAGTVTISNKTTLSVAIRNHRLQVKNTDVHIDTNIVFYTNITLALLNSMTVNIVLPNKGKHWMKFVAFNSILLAGDAVGIQRALGASYFAACYISADNLAWFSRLHAEVDNFLEQMFYYSTSTKERYDHVVHTQSVFAKLIHFK